VADGVHVASLPEWPRSKAQCSFLLIQFKASVCELWSTYLDLQVQTLGRQPATNTLIIDEERMRKLFGA
jgi:hypothetical protein